jgi:hypothetical protein
VEHRADAVNAGPSRPKNFSDEEETTMQPDVSTGAVGGTIFISEAIRNDPELKGAIAQANEILQERIDCSREPPAVTWTSEYGEQNSVRLRLRLSDATSAVETCFRLSEFRNAAHLKRNVFRLWSDFFQISSDWHFQKLHESVAQMEE